MKRGTLVILVSAILISACGPSEVQIATAISQTQIAQEATEEANPCGTEKVLAAIDEFDLIFEKWDDAADIAFSTARMSLAGPLGELQEIRREAKTVDVPPCFKRAKDKIEKFMESNIDGFLLFMSDEPDTEVSAKFKEADEYFDDFLVLSSEIMACAPDCP